MSHINKDRLDLVPEGSGDSHKIIFANGFLLIINLFLPFNRIEIYSNCVAIFSGNSSRKMETFSFFFRRFCNNPKTAGAIRYANIFSGVNVIYADKSIYLYTFAPHDASA